MKETLTSLAIGACVLLVILLVGAGTSWFGLVAGRPMAKYGEETRREVFETSRAHVSGTNSAISDYCLNMRAASDPAQKKAFARWIINEASTFQGALSADAAACRGEAQAIMDQAQ
jgi:hypothetical protein